MLGRPFMPWQRLVADVSGEVDERGRPYYREVRVTVPRQSGKTTALAAVMGQRSLGWGEPQRIAYTAQDRNNAREKWEEHVTLLDRSPLRGLYQVRRANGQERISWANGSHWGITAAGETSGHGMTLDVGVVDEAFAQRDERLSQAFRPAMMTPPERAAVGRLDGGHG